MLKEMPAVRTKFPVADFIESLIKGWKNITGEYPKKESVGVIVSQWSLETGGNSCWCYNICNIKAADDSSKTIMYCALNGVWEMIKGEKVLLAKSDPGSWFRAFETLDDGVAFYLDFLKNHRYKTAWSAIEAGKPADFAILLKKLGYYTASVDDYTKSMNYFFNKYMKDGTFETVMLKLNPAPLATVTAQDVDPIEIQNEPLVIIPDPIVTNIDSSLENNTNSTGNFIQNFFQAILKFFKK